MDAPEAPEPARRTTSTSGGSDSAITEVQGREAASSALTEANTATPPASVPGSAGGDSRDDTKDAGVCCGCFPRRWMCATTLARRNAPRRASLYKPSRESAHTTASAASPPPTAAPAGHRPSKPQRRRMYAFATFASMRRQGSAPRGSMASEPNTGDASELSELEHTEDDDNASHAASDRGSGRWEPASAGSSPPVSSDPASRQHDSWQQRKKPRGGLRSSSSSARAGVPEVSYVQGSFVGVYDCRVLIGKGSFGKVFLAVAPPATSAAGTARGSTAAAAAAVTVVALKVLPKAKLTTRRKLRLLADEKAVMALCGAHPFVLGLLHAFQTKDHLCLVSEFCPGGELFFHLERATRFPERVVRFYAAEMVSAVAYLHAHRVAYRDLKSENLLLDARGHLRLADFGLAAPNVSEWAGARSICGTPAYIAPEMIVKGGRKEGGYGFSVDWWSLGALLFDMLAGRSPFFDENMETMCDNILHKQLSFPPGVRLSSAARDLVAALLCRQPADRLGSSLRGGCAAVQRHEFFVGIKWAELEASASRPAPVQMAKAPGGEATALDTSNFDKAFTRLNVEQNLRPKRAAKTNKDRGSKRSEKLHADDLAAFLAEWNYVAPPAPEVAVAVL